MSKGSERTSTSEPQVTAGSRVGSWRPAREDAVVTVSPFTKHGLLCLKDQANTLALGAGRTSFFKDVQPFWRGGERVNHTDTRRLASSLYFQRPSVSNIEGNHKTVPSLEFLLWRTRRRMNHIYICTYLISFAFFRTKVFPVSKEKI